MSELLLELFSEEIPARMQADAARALEREMVGRLSDAGYLFEAARAFATPRRLTLTIEGLPGAQPDMREERKGPKVDAPQKAIDGFLASVGMTLDQVEKRETPKGAVYFAVIERKGRPTPEVIAEIVPEVIRGFHWPKSMRWGSGTLRWVRPLKSILCTYDGEVVPFSVDGIASGETTYGHRFMSEGAITATRFPDYEEKLQAAKVILDPARRRAQIEEDAKTLAFADNLEVVPDEGLLTEVAGLVEWPVVMMGRFDAGFLDVPEEVLITSMRAHQKYFSLRDPGTGKLSNRFIVVANLEAADGGEKMRAGYERVLHARLSDAKFFWDQDRKIPLAQRTERLKDVVFHAKLGSVADKVERMTALAGQIAEIIGADPEHAKRAAQLAKADLVTEMVYEFPELQGIMGRYYARNDGEPASVAEAINDHYRPQGPSDKCPSDPVTVAVALADKIDTLVGFWAIDEKPTGSKDPFALRRAALGVIRLVLENGLRLRLGQVFAGADRFGGEASHGDLLDFFADRLKVYLRDKGIKHDLIDAVFALPDQDDLVLILRRVEALKEFLGTDDGANLLAGFKRAANILRAEEKKDKTSHAGEADPGLFALPEETALHSAIAEASEKARAAVANEDFTGAMTAIAGLRAPIDAFFDTVTVNAEEAPVRLNRLRLLSRIPAALQDVADFSKLEG